MKFSRIFFSSNHFLQTTGVNEIKALASKGNSISEVIWAGVYLTAIAVDVILRRMVETGINSCMRPWEMW